MTFGKGPRAKNTPTTDNPFKPGMAVEYTRTIGKHKKMSRAVVARPSTWCRTAIHFRPPLIMESGREVRGMIVENRLLRKVEA